MLDRAGNVLVGGADEIEAAHHVIGFIRLLRDAAFVEVWRQGVVTGRGEAVGGGLDLIVEAPPFLDDDNAGLALACFGEIALAARAVGTLEVDHAAHCVSSVDAHPTSP